MVCDKLVVYVVCQVYCDVLYNGWYLIFVLFFEVDLVVVDVNVYLIKYEVCFCDSWMVYDFFYGILYCVLGEVCFDDQFVLFGVISLIELCLIGVVVGEFGLQGEMCLVESVLESLVVWVGWSGGLLVFGGFFGYFVYIWLEVLFFLVEVGGVYKVYFVLLFVGEVLVVLFESVQDILLLGYVLVQFKGIYIFVENVYGLVLVDMYVVYEWIIYECFKVVMVSEGLWGQLLLVLELIVVSECEVDCVEEYFSWFQCLGFELQCLGLESLVIWQIFVLFKQVEVIQLVCDVIVDLLEYGISDCIQVYLNELFGIMVCYGVVCVNWCLILLEMNVLLCDMEIIECSGQCNYGCLIWIQLGLDELDKFFLCGC